MTLFFGIGFIFYFFILVYNKSNHLEIDNNKDREAACILERFVVEF